MTVSDQMIARRQPKFAADVMLGSLARWLRILGYDVFYDNEIGDDSLVEISVTQDRILLTQDRRLTRRRRLDRFLQIESQSLPMQLRQVLRSLGLSPEWSQLFSRCLDCNVRLKEVRPEDIKEDVPQYVFETQGRFQKCPSCEKVFWPGTHRDHMLKQLRNLVGAGHHSLPGK